MKMEKKGLAVYRERGDGGRIMRRRRRYEKGIKDGVKR